MSASDENDVVVDKTGVFLRFPLIFQLRRSIQLGETNAAGPVTCLVIRRLWLVTGAQG